MQIHQFNNDLLEELLAIYLCKRLFSFFFLPLISFENETKSTFCRSELILYESRFWNNFYLEFRKLYKYVKCCSQYDYLFQTTQFFSPDFFFVWSGRHQHQVNFRQIQIITNSLLFIALKFQVQCGTYLCR